MGANPAFVSKRAEKMVKHGHKRGRKPTHEYLTWLGMKRRCYDTKYKDFPNWGGRGIRVCDEWNASFEAFLNDMGTRPIGEYGIDRIDPDGNYHLGNCRWATASQQGSEHKRSLVPVSVGGVNFQSIAEAARHFGVDVAKAWTRVSCGVPHDLAVSTVGRLHRTRTRESYLRKDRR